MVRHVLATPLLLALCACGGNEGSSPADGGAADAYVDPCEQEPTHDVCLATAGCAWYSSPLCTGNGSPFPINPAGCYSATLGVTPRCFTNADCAAGEVCIDFEALEECGPETVCPDHPCGGVASSWCRPSDGT